MKLDLYRDLLNHSSVMYGVFTSCIDSDTIKQIVDNTKNIYAAQGHTDDRPIEVSLRFDGIEVNPEQFFNNFYSQYEELIKREATKIVKEQCSDKYNEIIDKITLLDQVTNGLAEEINWEISGNNIFQK